MSGEITHGWTSGDTPDSSDVTPTNMNDHALTLHSFLGYNTIGGSTEVVTTARWYTKRITPTTDGVITSLGIYIMWGVDNLGAVMGAVYEDAAGPVPNKVLAVAIEGQINASIDLSEAAGTRNPRWLTVPCGLYVTAGSYWIGFQVQSATTEPTIYYDGSGSDRYWGVGGFRLVDGAYNAQTDSTRNYSMRASFITTNT